MSDIICVTNRKLCVGGFENRISEIAASKPAAIILREKDLSEDEYSSLYDSLAGACNKMNVPLAVHGRLSVAEAKSAPIAHLSLNTLQNLTAREREIADKTKIGASVHSVEEAKLAESLGANYLIFGHVYSTDCKKGLPPRGVSALKSVCSAVRIPVYAIGGITPLNFSEVLRAGARGACIMSGIMSCESPSALLKEFEKVRL